MEFGAAMGIIEMLSLYIDLLIQEGEETGREGERKGENSIWDNALKQNEKKFE